MRPELIGHFLFGRLHRGVISSVLDVTAGLALMCAIAEKHLDETATQVMNRFATFGTIDLQIDFLGPGHRRVLHRNGAGDTPREAESARHR